MSSPHLGKARISDTTAAAKLFGPNYLHYKPLHFDIAQFLANTEGILVDFGCGNKPYRSLVPHAVTKYVGVDIDASNSDVEVVAPADKTGLPDDYADFAICFQVLEHVPEPSSVLREIFRVLKPGGKLLLTAPQAWEVHEAPYDFYRYTEFGLSHLFEQAGFRNVSIRKQGTDVSLIGLKLSRFIWYRRLLLPCRLLVPLLNLICSRLDNGEGRDVINYAVSAEKPE